MSDLKAPPVRLRVGCYALRYPKLSESWVVTRVLAMIDDGVDVHVFCRWQGMHWSSFPVFDERPDLRERVHFMPDLPDEAWTVRTMVQVAARFVDTMRRHPRAFLRFVRHNWRWRKRNGLGFWRGLYQRLPFVGHSLDVLHLELDTLAPQVADIKHYLGCRLVLSGRSTLQHTGKADEWPGGYDLLFNMVDGYHVETEYTRSNLFHLGLDRSVATALIRNGIDLSRFQPAEDRVSTLAESTPLRILSVGRLAVEKGYEFALEAVALLHHEGTPVQFTIVGQGSYEEAVHCAAERVGLLGSGVVRFAGALAPEDLAKLYLEVDVLLHVSTDEGVPNVVIEAQATELPVVVSDAAGNPDAVHDGVTGFVVPRRDAAAAADKLRLLAHDPELRRAMGRAGRPWVASRYGTGGWTQEYVDFYRALGPARPAPAGGLA